MVVLVLAQWHFARIIAAAVPLLRSENPVSSQIEKLIPDSQVICQSRKPHAFTRVAHAFLLGGHGECSLSEPFEIYRRQDHLTLRFTADAFSRLPAPAAGEPALTASKTGSDILHTPNFHRDHRKSERAGRCLNLTHIQQGDRIASIGQNR